MTADGDDQDLVTVRIPRRAAALLASELEVASAPWLVKVGAYGGIVVSGLGLLAAVALLVTAVVQILAQNVFFASTCLVMSIIAGVVSSFLLAVSLQRARYAKRLDLAQA